MNTIRQALKRMRNEKKQKLFLKKSICFALLFTVSSILLLANENTPTYPDSEDGIYSTCTLLSPGTIAGTQLGCAPYNPGMISGNAGTAGSGTVGGGGSGSAGSGSIGSGGGGGTSSYIQYLWIKSTTGCPSNISQAIPGATGLSYNPPTLTQTTWYRRAARRVCTTISGGGGSGSGSGSGGGTTTSTSFSPWLYTNCIKITVDNSPNCEPPTEPCQTISVRKVLNTTSSCNGSGSPMVFLQKNCSGGANSYWIAGNDLYLYEYSNGTAELKGSIHKGGNTGTIDIIFTGKVGAASAWTGSCSIPRLQNTWYHYSDISGTVSLNGQTLSVQKRGDGPVVGYGSNTREAGLGFAAWTSGSFAPCGEIWANLGPAIHNRITGRVWSDENEDGIAEKSAPTNVALTGIASASTVHNASSASDAIDGNTNGLWANGSVFHSASGTENNTWWQVDLQEVKWIEEVNFWNRTDCCGERSKDLFLLISENPFSTNNLEDLVHRNDIFVYYFNNSTPNPNRVIDVNCYGRYVRIARDYDVINFAELQVFGRDFEEPGVPDVTVNLLDCNNSNSGNLPVLATTTTNADGRYVFENICLDDAPNNYIIEFNSSNSLFTQANVGNDDFCDSDAAVNTGRTTCFTLTQNSKGWDAGIVDPEPGSIGDFVWNDLNGDGIQNNGEPGIDGVTVKLQNPDGSLVETTTTNPSGFYQFTNVAVGDYKVMFNTPANFNLAPANQGGNDDLDSDVVDGEMTAVFTLNSGQNIDNIDAGYIADVPCDISISITNILCNDNGTPDNTDDDTYTFDLNVTGSGTSAEWQGNYSNPSLGAFGIPATLYNTPINLGPFPANGVDISIIVNDTEDSGYFDNQLVTAPGACSNGDGQAIIGDFVWDDLDADGIQDPGEPGLPFIFVILENCFGGFMDFTITNSNGGYEFKVDPGEYKIKFANPGGGYQVSPQNAGNDDALDSDMNFVGRTDCFSVSAGQIRDDLDGGFTKNDPPPACTLNSSVSNIECDNNGTSSPSDDTYSFTLTVTGNNLGSAWLAVINGNAVTGFYNTPIVLGPYPISGGTLSFEIKDNQDPNCDGIQSVIPPEPCSQPNTGDIGDFVWYDIDGDGIQDAGEPGLGGITVSLFKCDDTFVEETTTAGNGIYLFEDVPADMEYYVEFSNVPLGLEFSPANQGGNDALDSDANVAGRTNCILLNPGEENRTLDAGAREIPQGGTIGDMVWNDLDEDGIQDALEQGIPNVTVMLFRCDDTFVDQTTTNNLGKYSFNNVEADQSYYVKFSNLPNGFEFTTMDAGGNDDLDSDANENTGRTECFNITAGQVDNSRDAGIFETPIQGPNQLGNFVWNDLDGDGIQDPNEPGIVGVFVILETCAGQFAGFDVTDGNGEYLFEDIAPGNYRIKFANPGFPQISPQNQGNNDEVDSDMDFLGFTECITIDDNDIILSVDGGFTDSTPPPSCIIDATLIGTQCDDNGTPNDPFDDTFTVTISVSGGNGWGWIVNGITYTTYNTSVTLNESFLIEDGRNLTLTIIDADNSDCTDQLIILPPSPCSNNNPDCNNVSDAGSLGNEEIECAPFDPAPIIELSGPTGGTGILEYYWSKSTTDCPETAASPIQGATGPTYNPTSITQTTYYIRYVRSVGCLDWFASNCIAKIVDDCSGGGGELASVGDRIWEDTDGNGIQDSGEPGIGGVWVNLQDKDGNSISWGVSNGSGNYSFDNLTPGMYQIKFSNPGGFTPTLKDEGDDDSIDSDMNWINGMTDIFTLSAGESNIDVDAGFIPNGNFNGNPPSSYLETPNSKENQQVGFSEQQVIEENIISEREQLWNGMEKPSKSFDFSLYPNPANDFINIDLTILLEQSVQLQIFNTLGKRIEAINLTKEHDAIHQISLNDFKEGYYVIWLHSERFKPISKNFVVGKL